MLSAARTLLKGSSADLTVVQHFRCVFLRTAYRTSSFSSIIRASHGQIHWMSGSTGTNITDTNGVAETWCDGSIFETSTHGVQNARTGEVYDVHHYTKNLPAKIL